jgi:hypothetical protein
MNIGDAWAELQRSVASPSTGMTADAMMGQQGMGSGSAYGGGGMQSMSSGQMGGGLQSSGGFQGASGFGANLGAVQQNPVNSMGQSDLMARYGGQASQPPGLQLLGTNYFDAGNAQYGGYPTGGNLNGIPGGSGYGMASSAMYPGAGGNLGGRQFGPVYDAGNGMNGMFVGQGGTYGISGGMQNAMGGGGQFDYGFDGGGNAMGRLQELLGGNESAIPQFLQNLGRGKAVGRNNQAQAMQGLGQFSMPSPQSLGNLGPSEMEFLSGFFESILGMPMSDVMQGVYAPFQGLRRAAPARTQWGM